MYLMGRGLRFFSEKSMSDFGQQKQNNENIFFHGLKKKHEKRLT